MAAPISRTEHGCSGGGAFSFGFQFDAECDAGCATGAGVGAAARSCVGGDIGCAGGSQTGSGSDGDGSRRVQVAPAEEWRPPLGAERLAAHPCSGHRQALPQPWPDGSGRSAADAGSVDESARAPASLVPGYSVQALQLVVGERFAAAGRPVAVGSQAAGGSVCGADGSTAGAAPLRAAGDSPAGAPSARPADSAARSGRVLTLWKHVPPPDVAASLLAPSLGSSRAPGPSAPSAPSHPNTNLDPNPHPCSKPGEYDLVSGVYEGGFKTWECSVDLCEYLAAEWPALRAGRRGLRVAELGCGAALPAALTLALAALDEQSEQVGQPTPVVHELWAQDYNRQVLQSLSWPNFKLNGLAHRAADGGVRLLAGDWAACAQPMLRGGEEPPGEGAPAPKRPRGEAGAATPEAAREGAPARRFDLVLSADTIYSGASIGKLWALTRDLLEPEGGLALIAAKSYYFGVGGSVAQLKAAVEADGTGAARGLRYTARTVAQFADGKSNVREIVRIEAVSSSADAGTPTFGAQPAPRPP